MDEYASIWLRDNLADDRDLHSGQRLIDVADLPASPRIRSAVLDGDKIHVQWENDPREGTFLLAWLASQTPGAAPQRPERVRRLWLDGSKVDPSVDSAWAGLDELRANPTVRVAWLTRMLQEGIAFLSGVPATEGAILEAATLLGRVCETNYGLVFDVRSVPQPENLAYSDLGLGLHTDNPYREPVPGFQALHALVTSNEGGDSLFADGLALAEHLRSTEPAAFEVLTRTPVPFQYHSKGAELYAERPLIQLSCRGEVVGVHYNSRSVAPLRLGADAVSFYEAYRQFAILLREPRFHLKYRLRDGELVMFDNQRILHGRTSFSSARFHRHLRGCYLTRDSVYSEAAMLRRAVGEGQRPDAHRIRDRGAA